MIKNFLLRTETDILIFLMETIPNPEKNQYLNNVYGLCLSMLPCTEIDIKKTVKPDNYEMFTKSVCCYIYETGKTDYCFSNDYNKLIRK